MTTRRGGLDRILAGLRQADCRVWRASRIGGPRGLRSSLAGLAGFPEADIDNADDLEQIAAVETTTHARASEPESTCMT